MTRDEYYMTIAMAVRKKANCLGRKVGAVLVRENRIISTGYNGTPEGVTNCMDGGCARCKDRTAYAASVGYDVCVCVHAEMNALITAARFGTAVEDAVVYSTLRPCFDCTKALLQAKAHTIYYIHDWQHPIPALHEQYKLVQDKFPGAVRQLAIDDTDADWANGKVAALPGGYPQGNGHTDRV